LVLLLLVLAMHSFGQNPESGVQPRVLILLDESSSMILPWKDGTLKYKAAGQLIMKLMDSAYAINPEIEFSLRVFGHQSTVDENNCYDSKNEVPFAKENSTQMFLRLAAIRPLGITPIAYSLKEAGDIDMVDENKNVYSLVLITDGGESCNGDVCGAMKQLAKTKVFFKPYIVGLEDDPSLNGLYACMGNYLPVTKTGDIPGAVSAIVRGLMPAIKIKKTDYRELQANVHYGPPIIKINTSDFVYFEVKSAGFNIKRSDYLWEGLNFKIPLDSIGIIRSEGERAQSMRTDPLKLFALGIINLMSTVTLVPRTPPTLPPPVKFEPELPETKPAPPVAGRKDAGFKVETRDARETGLEIYFTDGKGSYYNSKPQVLLLEAGTNNVVRKFNRNVDGLGNIEEQKGIPGGVYDLAFTAKKGLWVHNVTLVANKLNRVVVNVTNTKLKFVYNGAPERPVKEFRAHIVQTNKPQGRVVDQLCTDLIVYEPGKYQVDLNTFPKESREIDMDFDEETEFAIDQPGFGTFLGSELKKHFVELYQKTGKDYTRFYTLDVNDPESKRLRIQPGEYQVRYQTGAERTVSPVITLPFTITAAKETVIELK